MVFITAIAQGRLEALINYQTMIADLTAMDISNASLLDEPTAAAEAMMLAHRVSKSKSNNFFVQEDTFHQTISIIKSRAKPLGIEIQVGDEPDDNQDYFGCYLQWFNSCRAYTQTLCSVVECSICNIHLQMVQSKIFHS